MFRFGGMLELIMMHRARLALATIATSGCFYSPTGSEALSGGESTTQVPHDPATDSGSHEPTLETTSSSQPGTTSGEPETTGTSSTTDIATDAGVSSTTGPDPDACMDTKPGVSFVKPSVILLLDKSGSMVSNLSGFWDHDADDVDEDGVKDSDPNMAATPEVTRWNSLWRVIDAQTHGFDGSTNMGMVLYPAKTAQNSYSEAACVVNGTPDVQVGSMHALEIVASIPGPNADSTAIQGGTPTTRGIKAALAGLADVPGDQPKFMVLITDGAANCQEMAPDNTTLFEVYDEDLAPTVAAAAAVGIKTHVVGIEISQSTSGVTKDGNPDNTNSYERLNEVAIAGGVPRAGQDKFFNVADEAQLQSAVGTALTQITGCTLGLDPSPVHPGQVEVTVKAAYGSTQVGDCATESGWRYSPENDPDGPVEIELCGQACDDFHMSGMVDVTYRCPR